MLNRNSFCIVNVSFLRKHGISPKNMNIHEYKFLLHSFKAVFAQLDQDSATAAEEIKKATEMKEKFGQDPVKFRANVNLPAQIQH